MKRTVSDAGSSAGVSKQTAGAVTGAVVGGVVAGPVGALAGGAVGAIVGDSSAKGKKPIKRAVDAIREEITSGHAKQVLKSVGEKFTSLGKRKKAPVVMKKAASGGDRAVKKAKGSKRTTKSGKSATAAKRTPPRGKTKRAKRS